MQERWLGGYDPRGTNWVVVWKFPGDLNYLTDKNGQNVYNKIYNIPLPVGNYSMCDDKWFVPSGAKTCKQLKKNVAVEKLRIDVVSGNGIHYLESATKEQVAMIGSHFYIEEFWNATSNEKENVANMLQELYYKHNVYAFSCYSQHHAIVFYMKRDTEELITPTELARLLNEKPFLNCLQKYSKTSLDSWASNYIRFICKDLDVKKVPKAPVGETSNGKNVYALHNQPHPTGSLLRKFAGEPQDWISYKPVPNNVFVAVLVEENEFCLISFRELKGWVRKKYLTF